MSLTKMPNIGHLIGWFGASSADHSGAVQPLATTIHNLRVVRIDDIIRNPSNDDQLTDTLEALESLIRQQAQLHDSGYTGNPKKLRKTIREMGNRVRGFFISSDKSGPIAYAIYYPMIDHEGRKVAYCEDFFITAPSREWGQFKDATGQRINPNGIGQIIFHELAKRAKEDGYEALVWATDIRNKPAYEFATKKLGAKHPPVITLDAVKLIDDEVQELFIQPSGIEAKYKTRPIDSRDRYIISHFSDKIEALKKEGHNDLPNGLERDLIATTGDIDFRGFITFDKKTEEPIAITFGWNHTSTFRLESGIHLETPIVLPDTESEDSLASRTRDVILSTSQALKKLYDGSKIPEPAGSEDDEYRDMSLHHLRWHIFERNEAVMETLMGDFKLPKDSMLGTDESELVVMKLENGALENLAKEEPSMTLIKPDSYAFQPKNGRDKNYG